MASDLDEVWVSIEVTRGGNLGTIRRRIHTADYEAVVAGNHFSPFLTIEDVHWVEWVWNESEQRFRTKFTRYGKDGQWKWHVGSMSIRTDIISSIAILKDCSSELKQRDQFSE